MERGDKREVVYPKGKAYKRIFAFTIDLFLAVIIGLLFGGLSWYLTTLTPAYKNQVEIRERIIADTSIYGEDGQLLTLYLDTQDLTIAKKRETLKQAIEDFYHDDKFFDTSKLYDDNSYYIQYLDRQKNATYQGENIFIVDENDSHKYNTLAFSDQVYYDFYALEIENYCNSLLSLNEDFANASNFLVRTNLIELLLSFGVGYVLSFLLTPLILKRGRKTVGMYLFKLSLIDVDALNVRGKKLLVRSLFAFLIQYALSIVTLFIPWVVSLTMMIFSKSGQDFIDYMTNTYVVDSSKRDVYLDYAEFLLRNDEKEQASIENKDFNLTR